MGKTKSSGVRPLNHQQLKHECELFLGGTRWMTPDYSSMDGVKRFIQIAFFVGILLTILLVGVGALRGEPPALWPGLVIFWGLEAIMAASFFLTSGESWQSLRLNPLWETPQIQQLLVHREKYWLAQREGNLTEAEAWEQRRVMFQLWLDAHRTFGWYKDPRPYHEELAETLEDSKNLLRIRLAAEQELVGYLLVSEPSLTQGLQRPNQICP